MIIKDHVKLSFPQKIYLVELITYCIHNMQKLTKRVSSSESDLYVRSKRLLHLPICASIFLLSMLDENSLEISNGSSIEMTAKNLALLRASAATKHQS